MFEFEDEELGKIVVKLNKRAKHVIARRKSDFIQVTVPYGFNMKNLPSVLTELKPRLMRIKPAAPKLITEDTVIETFSFKVKFVRSSSLVDCIRFTIKNGELHIVIPSDADFSEPKFQEVIKAAIIEALRIEAKRIFSKKTLHFAQKHGLKFNKVKVNNSKGRWGSCSRQKNINFSLFLLLMPEKFIDYVVLHELAHTVEMNHSEKFWKLLSNFCGEDAKALSKSFKRHSSESYALLAE